MREILQKMRQSLIKNPVYIALAVYLLFCIVLVPDFANVNNITNVLKQSCVIIISACGLTYVVLNGGADFSITSIIALTSVFGASIMSKTRGLLPNSPLAVPVAILIMLFTGVLFGAINGFSIIKFKMPSFIVTMATQMVGVGLAVWYTQSETIGNLPDSFTVIGTGSVFNIPITVLCTIFVVIILHIILSKTMFGRQVYAVGTNPKTSEISGIQVKKVIFSLYIVSGICASVAGIVMAAQMESGASGFASNIYLDILASVIIGGTSITGGHGSIPKTVAGGLFIMMISNSLNLLNVPYYFIDSAKGAIIIIAAFIDLIRLRHVPMRPKIIGNEVANNE